MIELILVPSADSEKCAGDDDGDGDGDGCGGSSSSSNSSSSRSKLLQHIPSTIEIFQGLHGLGLRCGSHGFVKGELIDSIGYVIIPNECEIYDLCNVKRGTFQKEGRVSEIVNGDESSSQVYPLHSITNTLLYTDKERVCNGYVGYINHRCSGR